MSSEQRIAVLETELAHAQGEVEAFRSALEIMQKHETRVWHKLRAERTKAGKE